MRVMGAMSITEKSLSLHWSILNGVPIQRSTKLPLAGNETFHQGRVSFSDLIEHIKSKSITVNTVYCGPEKETW